MKDITFVPLHEERHWTAHSTRVSDFIIERVTKLLYAKQLLGIYSTFNATHLALYLS